MLSSAKLCGNLKGYKHRAYYRIHLHGHKYCLLNLCTFRKTNMGTCINFSPLKCVHLLEHVTLFQLIQSDSKTNIN